LSKAQTDIDFLPVTFMLVGQFGVDCPHSSWNNLKRL
jgi:hypothetical protein